MQMESIEISHTILFIFEEGSAIRGVERVAGLAVGVYHIEERTKAREADAMSRSVRVSVTRMRLRTNPTKILESTN